MSLLRIFTGNPVSLNNVIFKRYSSRKTAVSSTSVISLESQSVSKAEFVQRLQFKLPSTPCHVRLAYLQEFLCFMVLAFPPLQIPYWIKNKYWVAVLQILNLYCICTVLYLLAVNKLKPTFCYTLMKLDEIHLQMGHELFKATAKSLLLHLESSLKMSTLLAFFQSLEHRSFKWLDKWLNLDLPHHDLHIKQTTLPHYQ